MCIRRARFKLGGPPDFLGWVGRRVRVHWAIRLFTLFCLLWPLWPAFVILLIPLKGQTLEVCNNARNRARGDARVDPRLTRSRSTFIAARAARSAAAQFLCRAVLAVVLQVVTLMHAGVLLAVVLSAGVLVNGRAVLAAVALGVLKLAPLGEGGDDTFVVVVCAVVFLARELLRDQPLDVRDGPRRDVAHHGERLVDLRKPPLHTLADAPALAQHPRSLGQPLHMALDAIRNLAKQCRVCVRKERTRSAHRRHRSLTPEILHAPTCAPCP
mmetsp:Transcript_28243/g.80259  ORF Transcript_28243/g.80259 Transcript_28243/m.80259 type:complete len:270 (+) Transcript_28243:667-1476(+)